MTEEKNCTRFYAILEPTERVVDSECEYGLAMVMCKPAVAEEPFPAELKSRLDNGAILVDVNEVIAAFFACRRMIYNAAAKMNNMDIYQGFADYVKRRDNDETILMVSEPMGIPDSVIGDISDTVN